MQRVASRRSDGWKVKSSSSVFPREGSTASPPPTPVVPQQDLGSSSFSIASEPVSEPRPPHAAPRPAPPAHPASSGPPGSADPPCTRHRRTTSTSRPYSAAALDRGARAAPPEPTPRAAGNTSAYGRPPRARPQQPALALEPNSGTSCQRRFATVASQCSAGAFRFRNGSSAPRRTRRVPKLTGRSTFPIVCAIRPAGPRLEAVDGTPRAGTVPFLNSSPADATGDPRRSPPSTDRTTAPPEPRRNTRRPPPAHAFHRLTRIELEPVQQPRQHHQQRMPLPPRRNFAKSTGPWCPGFEADHRRPKLPHVPLHQAEPAACAGLPTNGETPPAEPRSSSLSGVVQDRLPPPPNASDHRRPDGRPAAFRRLGRLIPTRRLAAVSAKTPLVARCTASPSGERQRVATSIAVAPEIFVSG